MQSSVMNRRTLSTCSGTFQERKLEECEGLVTYVIPCVAEHETYRRDKLAAARQHRQLV